MKSSLRIYITSRGCHNHLRRNNLRRNQAKRETAHSTDTMAMQIIYEMVLGITASLDVANPTTTPTTSKLSQTAVNGITVAILVVFGVFFIIASALAYKYGCCYPVWEDNARRNQRRELDTA